MSAAVKEDGSDAFSGLIVSIARQTLALVEQGQVVQLFSVSTAARGAGELQGSEKTPRGRLCIADLIGADLPENTVFVGRRPTGEIYTPVLEKTQPERDWILTRILRLEGCEPGRNQGDEVDTLSRYIYIHGSPDNVPMGMPGSHGCIRMRNTEIIGLFDRVTLGMSVLIEE
jgi:hypothetical protein